MTGFEIFFLVIISLMFLLYLACIILLPIGFVYVCYLLKRQQLIDKEKNGENKL